jgi:hypothetical protein
LNNDIDKIYQEFGENFCICPFLGIFYQTSRVEPADATTSFNTVTPCSLTSYQPPEFVVQNHSILESVNTDNWREIRRNFISGDWTRNTSCEICINHERHGVSSARKGANLHYVHHCETDIISEIKKIVANDYRVTDILSMDFYPSNYCNFSCVMCAGGASSTRLTYEIKIRRVKQKIIINAVDPDFHDILRRVEIINFTGGETVMQTQVLDLIQYLVDNDMAANKTIFLLTNCSSYPDNLIENFRKFRRVIYMCSLDGIGPVIEYQRRGAVWRDVERNSLKIIHHEFIGTVVNFVLTCINVLNVMEFVDWCYTNRVPGVGVTPVFREEHLGMTSLPPELRELALLKLHQGLERYKALPIDPAQTQCVGIINSVLAEINSTQFDPQHLQKFARQIQQEDQESRTPFLDIVPEWRPFFHAALR